MPGTRSRARTRTLLAMPLVGSAVAATLLLVGSPWARAEGGPGGQYCNGTTDKFKTYNGDTYACMFDGGGFRWTKVPPDLPTMAPIAPDASGSTGAP